MWSRHKFPWEVDFECLILGISLRPFLCPEDWMERQKAGGRGTKRGFWYETWLLGNQELWMPPRQIRTRFQGTDMLAGLPEPY